MRPSTPSSLVKFASREASVSTGSDSSTPTRPQVPRLMYAARSLSMGTATTADAVSCEPTATTVPDRPVGARSGPITSPGHRSAGSTVAGRWRAASTCGDHCLVRTSSNPVVEAFVTSAPLAPVSQYASRSGISSRVSAPASRCSAQSW